MLRHPAFVIRPSTIFKGLLQNHWASRSQVSCEASMGGGEWKFVRGVWVTWPSWPPRPYMVKPFKNLFLQNQRASDLVAWYVALGLWVHHSLFKWWPWVDLDLFYGLLCFYMGKTVRKSFNGRNLQQMARVTKGLCLYKNSDPKALFAPCPRAIYKYKNMKNYV